MKYVGSRGQPMSIRPCRLYYDYSPRRSAAPGRNFLHREYPKNRAALAGKHGPAPEVRAPEEFPSLKGKYGPKLDYTGKVVQSCIHCHQVGEAQRLAFRTAGKPIPDKVLYPYPHPKILGLVMDPAAKATVKSVRGGSTAEIDGFKPGDEITTLSGQPVLSIADIQWVLHHAGPSGKIATPPGRWPWLTPTFTPSATQACSSSA
jgi:serine protease Do